MKTLDTRFRLFGPPIALPVNVVMTVTDTQTGAVKTCKKPAGDGFPAGQGHRSVRLSVSHPRKDSRPAVRANSASA
jgi:hypothetical protein